jgi:hypothetical protein
MVNSLSLAITMPGVNAAHSGVPGKDSELLYTATETGDFYVEVKGGDKQAYW